ncbi:E3 ubiquitin-protein ligase complex slx8-rfp subunit slx8 [Lachnellula suecica]|uniref:E3 ubiquitin-protein ligase complex slx8-rfp subunit slx8 n=1 Tax=Lachnellula suecica TaxID=602035 RepID=A0A8T9BTS7_9HELO|nr:E3 ubiquitin-protein ligase complex slx8-rfp subunit slx8 [Lachnellula suecica]
MSSDNSSPLPYSPYYSPPSHTNSNSPWSAPSPFGSDDLTLPPINPDADNLGELPSFMSSAEYFALPPNPFLPEASRRAQEIRRQQQAPLASLQQEQHSQPRTQGAFSQYRIGESESPDLFEDDVFADLVDFVGGLSPGSPAPMPPSRTTTRRSSIVDLTSSPPDNTETMVNQKKRKTGESAAGRGRPKKAAKTTVNGGASSSGSRRQSMGDSPVMIDLADVEDEEDYKKKKVADAETKAKEKAAAETKKNQDEATKSVKLSDFQCIICMDNPTDLTITHCGHLFCAECLHQALHAGDKKCCPVCRTPIRVELNNKGKMHKSGVFVLEMKLMTQNRKGKRPMK